MKNFLLFIPSAIAALYVAVLGIVALNPPALAGMWYAVLHIPAVEILFAIAPFFSVRWAFQSSVGPLTFEGWFFVSAIVLTVTIATNVIFVRWLNSRRT